MDFADAVGGWEHLAREVVVQDSRRARRDDGADQNPIDVPASNALGFDQVELRMKVDGAFSDEAATACRRHLSSSC